MFIAGKVLDTITQLILIFNGLIIELFKTIPIIISSSTWLCHSCQVSSYKNYNISSLMST